MVDPLSLGTGIVGIVSLAIQVVGILDNFIENWRKVPVEVLCFRAELNRLVKTLEDTNSVLSLQENNAAIDKLPEWISACQADLGELANNLTISPKCSIQKGWDRIKKALRSDSLNRSVAKLHRFCQQVNQQVNIGTLAVVSESQIELRQIADRQSKEFHRKILRWLSTFNHTKRHEDLREQWHPGTANWIFDNDSFLDWATGLASDPGDADSNTTSPLILWCYGGPGVGKSVMMSQVVEHLLEPSQNDVAILYLYCDYKDRENQSLLALLSTLVRQATMKLAELTGFPEEVVDVYRRYTEGESGDISREEAQKLLQTLLKKFRRSFILLDGLDEYVHSSGMLKVKKPNELLENVHQVVTECEGTCRLFLTSRENSTFLHPDIQATKLPVEGKDSDIRSYVNSYIRNADFSHSDEVNENDSLAEEITSKITKKASGQFLLASFLVQDIDEQPSVRDLKEALDDLPLSQFTRYEESLKRIEVQQRRPSKAGPLGFKILGLILHACRSLTVEEMQHALAIRPGDKKFSADGIIDTKTIVSHTAGLLRIKDNTIQFVHNSIFEFLRDSSIYRKTFSLLEELLTQICMTYMCLEDFAEPCEDQPQRFEEFAFLRYATRYFGFHATSCVRRNPGLLTQYINVLRDIPLGSLQVFASKVLQRPAPQRIQLWRDNISQLHLAIVVGLAPVIEDMLKQQEDIEQTGYKDETPLHMAARSSDKAATELLLQYGADIRKTNYSGKNALDMIMNEPYTRVEMKLMEVDFIEQLTSMLLIRFIAAATDETSEVDRKVFAELIDEDKRNEFLKVLTQREPRESSQKSTELVLAANLEMDITDEQADTVLVLIDAGVDLNCKEATLGTPLQLAVIYRRKEIVARLLEKGANPFLDYSLGYNALELAQQRKETASSQDIERLISDKMQQITELENAEPDEAKKALIPGQFQTQKLLEEAEKKSVERFRRQVTYEPRNGFGIRGLEALLLVCGVLDGIDNISPDGL